jgi:F-type H+-transporting ATPase subunit a
MRARLTVLAVTLLALTAPPAALARGEFHPEDEFTLKDWVPIHLGPLNLSINKAVTYLLLGTFLTILFGIFLMRSRLALLPGKRQTVGEALYEVTQSQIAEQGLPAKAVGRWFPYVASLALFIWTLNMIGFIPLPISNEKWHGVPTWGIYAATANLSVTLALTILTVFFTHFEGIRWNGPRRYFSSWIPAGLPERGLSPAGLLGWVLFFFIVFLEIASQLMRLVSLSVRLFANMLAGHMLILTFIGLMFVLQTVALAVITVPVATLFYLFEVIIVVTIQAYIFAALSAIYIGSAIEPEH